VSVHLINGEYPMRILDFVRGKTWRGTTILP
jgi:aspartokinase-like uncharacterized kinase